MRTGLVVANSARVECWARVATLARAAAVAVPVTQRRSSNRAGRLGRMIVGTGRGKELEVVAAVAAQIANRSLELAVVESDEEPDSSGAWGLVAVDSRG